MNINLQVDNKDTLHKWTSHYACTTVTSSRVSVSMSDNFEKWKKQLVLSP